MLSHLSDEEIIRQSHSQSSNQAFESLYTKYVNKVYQQCLSLTHDSEKAQDFTQDIFIKAFGKLDDFQQRSSVSTWLTSIARNYCFDQLRLAKRLPTTALDWEVESSLSESPEQQPEEENRQRALSALASLPLAEQTFFRQKYEQGLSIEELAQLYDMKISAVKMRLKRSREKIQRLYAQGLSE